MKALIFSVAYHPFVGGAEIAVKEITDRISDIEFHMVTVNIDGRQKNQEKIGNVLVHRVSAGFLGHGYIGRLFFPFTGALKALALHRDHKFDITWSIMANYAGFAALFFKFVKPQVPFVLTLQEGDPISYIKRHVWFVYPLFVQIFRRADRIQTISNYLADFARSMGARAPIEVIPNGVDVSIFDRDYPADELESLKNKYGGKNPEDIFLITTSRLVVKNGIADVIKALEILPSNIKFLVLGVGLLESSLRKLAQVCGVSDRVIFVGQVSYSEILKFLKISDIFIRPSLSEGMGNSFIEAMAAGLPVIATRVGGIPDFLFEGQTGISCEVKSPKSIAEKVQMLVSDANLRANLISNAKKMVRERYDWELIASQMKDVFNP